MRLLPSLALASCFLATGCGKTPAPPPSTGTAPDAAPLTMVFASHHLGQVRRLAQRVICLDQGRVLADLPVAQFFDHARLSSVAPVAAAFVQGEM